MANNLLILRLCANSFLLEIKMRGYSYLLWVMAQQQIARKSVQRMSEDEFYQIHGCTPGRLSRFLTRLLRKTGP